MNVAELLSVLTTEQKARLTAGSDMWTVPGVPEHGIPPMVLTDGPNGARGSALLGAGRATALCVPCGSALGATWDPALVQEVGAVLGAEARTKSARVLLAPTVNLPRSPLAGRNFECYAEDPLLSGRTAAAFVRGVQSQGVAATVKHLVGNEAEYERTTISSDIEERALRELYLVPFELAVREGGVMAVMTSYNRVNGTWCSEDVALLRDWLRGELAFDGIVMTDWVAVGSTEGCASAGLDLQMPGPDRFYGQPLADAVTAGAVPAQSLDAIATRWLTLVDRLGAWSDQIAPEQSVELTEHREIARRAAAAATVLLCNDGVLPLADDVASVALIGPNAATAHIMGGGSAQLRPHRRVTPLDALRDRLGDRVQHEPGCVIDKTVRPLRAPVDVEYFASTDWTGAVVAKTVEEDLRLLWFGAPDEALDAVAFSLRATVRLAVTETGRHLFTLVQSGRARLRVDGTVLIDGIASPPPSGTLFFGLGSEEVTAEVELTAGSTVDVVVEYTSVESYGLHGVAIGYRAPEPDDLLARAVELAARSAVAVVVVGTSEEWESEGHDRTSLHLPGDQDELVRRVCAANPHTVVVVNAGAPVVMPWVEQAAAVLLPWLGGQEMATALGQVLFGEEEPAGRLCVTLPERIEHTPAYGAFPGENHRAPYREGLLVGYRWYDTRHLPVRFPFGHGGSYTTFEWDAPVLSAQSVGVGETLRVEVTVRNTGTRRGAEVVQCYVEPPAGPLFRPRCELRGFAKLWLDPGESATATIELGPRAFAYWDPGSTETAHLAERLGAGTIVPAETGPAARTTPGWYVDSGDHAVVLGRSVADPVSRVVVELAAAGPLDG